MHNGPSITPIRDPSFGYGMWPWAQGPLFRLDDDWAFQLRPGNAETFVIPAGYEFDKASIPSIIWGFPLCYTPDGLCTVPALEHDYLCDLFNGGSDWLKRKLGRIPAAPWAQDIHQHFYLRLLEQPGMRPRKARVMYEAVRNFGPGGRLKPTTWWESLKGNQTQ